MDSNLKNIKCGMVNAQSVGNKTLKIRELFDKDKLDILCITETWLKPVIDDAKINEMVPESYTSVHKMRNCQNRGGGVSIIISKKFKFKQILDKGNFDTFEYIEIQADTQKGKTLIINIYKPPNTNENRFLEEFELFLNMIDTDMNNVLICGDFNLRLNCGNNITRRFSNILREHNLKNYLNFSTSSSENILQLILSSCEKNNVKNIETEPDFFYGSVHKLVTFFIDKQTYKKYRKTITYRDKRNFNPEVFIETCADKIKEKWQEPCSCLEDKINHICIHCKTKIYNEILQQEYEQACPLITKQIMCIDNAPWFTSEIKDLRKNRREAERRWRKSKTLENRTNYVIIRNQVNEKIRETKLNYYNSVSEREKDLNKLYGIFDSLLGVKKENILPDNENDDKNLAIKFVKYFENKIKLINEILEVERNNINTVDAVHTGLHDLNYEPLKEFKMPSIQDTLKVINNAKKTVSDRDPIPIKDVSDASNFQILGELIHNVVCDSIALSRFPYSEKIACVLPTYKGKEDKNQLSSYRPISNLTFMSKVIEITVKEQLCEYLSENNLLPKEQSAYRKNHSTETVMLAMANDFLESLDNKKNGILILLDLSAAFDTVNHELLLNNLFKLGLKDKVLEWFRDYLENRQMYVKVRNSKSEMTTLLSGVPQGSVLGPILFSMYTRELANILEQYDVRFKLYADDCQIYIEFGEDENIGDRITQIIMNVKKWMTRKWLKLNDNKTVFTYIGNNENVKTLLKEFSVCGNKLELTKATKDLGVIIDESFKLENQISEVVKICNYQLRKIASIKKYLTKKSREKLIHNYVLSKIDYCNSLYYHLPKKTLKPLQLIMNKAARVVSDTRRRDNITPILIDLHWLPVKARIEYKLDLLTYKTLKTKEPKYLHESLQLVNQQSQRNTHVKRYI